MRNISPASRRLTVLLALACLVTLIGCAPPVYLMPTPVALAGGDFNPFRQAGDPGQDTRLSVFYATNPIPLSNRENPGGPVYTIFAGDTVRLGLVDLRIGDEKFDFRALFKMSTGAQTDRRPPLYMQQIEEWAAFDLSSGDTPLSAAGQRFFDAVNSALAASADKELFIYVHGANANVYRASAQAAQYRHFTGRNSVVLVFAWPSAENLLKYSTDVEHAAKTAPLFARFIELLAGHTNAEHLNILAYSAGTQVASPGLALLGQRRPGETVEQATQRLRLGEVYFAAPDADFRRFVHDLSNYIDLARNVTLTVNLNDDVLAFAQFHHGVSRAGRPDLAELDEEESQWLIDATQQTKFDVIDIDPATIPEMSSGSHAYWYDHPWVSTDVLVQFLFHARPAERGLVLNRTPDGGQYWTFPPDYDKRIIDKLKALGP